MIEIPDRQISPFTPHKLTDVELQMLKEVGQRINSDVVGIDAMILFKNWIDDRILYHHSVKPLLFYTTISNIIKHRKIKVRKEVLDTRIPLLIYIQSGGGKSIFLESLFDLNKEIVKILKHEIKDNFIRNNIIGKRFIITKRQKVTAEALLGTIYGGKSEEGEPVWYAELGALGTDSVSVINEASIFFQTESENMKNVFPYVCEALDPIGSKANEVNKQLTGKPPLWYATETNFILFCQPDRANVDLGLITSGTLPRFVVMYSPVSEKFQRDVFKFRMYKEIETTDVDTKTLAKFLVGILSEDRDFELSQEAIDQLIIEMEALEDFASRERAAGIYLKTSYQRIINMIIKMSAVICAARFDYIITKEDVIYAANDYRASFVTAMVFFVSQNISGFKMSDRQYALMQEIEFIWEDYDFILPKKVLLTRIKGNKKFDVSEKTINNMLSVLHSGRFIYWDRGAGGKQSYIVHPDIPEGDIRNLIMEREEIDAEKKRD